MIFCLVFYKYEFFVEKLSFRTLSLLGYKGIKKSLYFIVAIGHLFIFPKFQVM